MTAVTQGSCPEVISDTGSYTIAFAGACELEDEYNRSIAHNYNYAQLNHLIIYTSTQTYWRICEFLSVKHK